MFKKVFRVGLVAFILAVLVGAFNVVPVSASSTLIIRPDGAGDVTGLVSSSGSDNYDMVNESSPDGDSTYVKGQLMSSAYDLYQMSSTEDAGIRACNILSIEVRFNGKQSYSAISCKGGFKTGGTEYLGSSISFFDMNQNGAYIDKSAGIWTTNPKTSTAWTWDDIDDIQGKLYEPAPLSASVRISQYYIIVNYVSVPTLTLSAANNITASAARLNGNITDTGGESSTVTLYWGTTDHPGTATGWDYSSEADSPSQPQGVAAFYEDTSPALTPGTTYYFTAKAVNSAGTTWISTDLSFTTLPAPPADVSATDGTETDKVVVTWTKSTGATGYKVYRDGTNVGGTLGDVATYDDTGADAPVITPGTASASDGASLTYVTLSLAGESVANGTTHTYKVVAVNATGDSADSSTNTGYRGHGTLSYQWQRSAADSDASYSNITSATTDPYNDTAAPAYSAARYFKCVLSATGAANATSTSNRGWRCGSPTITLKTATNVSFTTAKLNSTVTEDGGLDCQVRYGYGTTSETANDFANYDTLTEWVDGYNTDDDADLTITALDIDTVYYYRVQVKNTGGTVTSTSELYFDTTAQPSMLSDYTVTSSGSDILDTNPLMPPQMYTELSTSGIPIIGDIVDDILDQSDTPPALWWYPFIFFGLGIFGLLIYNLTIKNGGTGSELLLSIIIETGLILFGIMGYTNTGGSVIPLWPAFLFPIPCIAIIMSRKTFSW